MRRGGLLRRALAFHLDQVIVGFVSLLGTLWLALLYLLTADDPAALPSLIVLAGAALWLCAVLNGVYFVGFVGLCGQTPAKMLAGVRVVRRDGGRAGFGRALLRWIGYGVVLGTLGLGWLVALLDAERRGLHDWIAGTRVVRNGG